MMIAWAWYSDPGPAASTFVRADGSTVHVTPHDYCGRAPITKEDLTRIRRAQKQWRFAHRRPRRPS